MENNAIRPNHYRYSEYEPKDVIRSWNLNFNLGSAVKYIARAGRKDDIIQDLNKAKTFIEFEIEFLEKQREKDTKIENKYENYGEMYPPSQVITKIE